MSKIALIAIIVFIVSLLLIFIIGKNPLTKSAKEFGIGNAVRNVALLSAAITVVIVLILKYAVL